MGKRIIPMSDKVHLINCPALSIIIDKYATEFPVNGKTYYEVPFYFEKEGNALIMHFKAPEDLNHFIMRANLGNPNPQPITKHTDVKHA